MARPPRPKNKDNARRAKKRVSILQAEKIEYVDYKDVNLLRRFLSDRAKIRARRVTGNDTKQQAEIAMAIKNAREMALVPYASRVTQQRGGRRDRDERRGRDEPPVRVDRPVLRAQAVADRRGLGPRLLERRLGPQARDRRVVARVAAARRNGSAVERRVGARRRS